MQYKKGLLAAAILSLPLLSAYAQEEKPSQLSEILMKNDQNSQFWLLNLGGIGIVTVYGMSNWGYFSRSPHSQYEGWFAQNTDYGGADKLGHMYTTYVAARGFTRLYERWGFDDPALYGALSSALILGYVEFGDAFSEFGFSNEDIIANCVGALFGYVLHTTPDLDRKVDLRWEYGMNSLGGDFVTDYENAKYLAALKLNGFDTLNTTLLRHLELHVGYYTRGYTDPFKVNERNLYFGLGFNLTDLLQRHDYRAASTLLKYYQIPQTYLHFDNDLNR